MKDNEYTEFLAHLIRNPEEVGKFVFLTELLDKEDYIIFFYLYNNHIRGFKLDNTVLSMFLEKNMIDWVSPKSRLFKDSKMSLDYIKSKTETILNTQVELGRALKEIVLERFNELTNISKNNELKYSEEEIKDYAEFQLGKNLVEDTLTVIREGVWDNKRRKAYKPADIVKYMAAKIEDITESLNGLETNQSYNNQMENEYAISAMSKGQVFEWNLGSGIKLPPVNKGHMISILAPPKVGKTKFTIGEMAYNTIRQGGNVLLYSGEMDKTDMMAFMVTKHIYVETKKKVFSSTVNNILAFHFWEEQTGLTKDIVEKELERRDRINKNPKNISDEDKVALIDDFLFKELTDNMLELLKYYKTDKTKKELVLDAYSELSQGNKYGKLYVKDLSDGVFDVDTVVARTTKFNVENEIDLFIVDHVGFTTSLINNLSKYEGMTKMYQYGKEIANHKENKVATVLINHTDTDTTKEILAGKKPTSPRAFGAAEASKSADTEYILYELPDNKKEGTVVLGVLVSRHEAVPLDEIVLISDRSVNDFKGVSTTKQPYPMGKAS